MDWLKDFFLPLFIALSIALVSAHITVRLALKRFRSEKRWLRKMEAYERIIEALHHLKASAQAGIDVVQKPPNSYPAPGPELTQRWREAYLVDITNEQPRPLSYEIARQRSRLKGSS